VSDDLGGTVERDGDVWRYHASRQVPDGIQTRTIEWDHEPTPEQVAIAEDWDGFTPQVGEVLLSKVIGPFFWFKDVGPPAWRWPKVTFSKWGVGLGWRMTAYYVSLRTQTGRSQGGGNG
jgi:hypothetical protein